MDLQANGNPYQLSGFLPPINTEGINTEGTAPCKYIAHNVAQKQG